MNATDPQEMRIYRYSPSYGGYEDFLKAALSSKPTANEAACRMEAGIVSKKLVFVYKGDTYIALTIGNMTYYATPEIGLKPFTKLLSAEIRAGYVHPEFVVRSLNPS